VCALTLALTASLLATAPVLAQTPAQTPAPVRHVVDSTALEAAVHQKITAEAADRNAIRTAVHQPEAQAVAKRLGLTPTRVDDAVQTMSPAEVAALAPTARMANDPQAGGDITISVTVLLLLLILLVLIVK
jgi:hypothetical protein